MNFTPDPTAAVGHPDTPAGNPLVQPEQTPEQKRISELEAENIALQERAGQTTDPAALTAPRGISDTDIQWSQIEPGIKWGVNQGLIDVKSLGDHIARLFEENG